MIKIISYNINGLRAGLKKDLLPWLKAANPDLFCLQEIKANPDQVDTRPFEEAGYKHYWFSAQKKGYSGVAIFTKLEPGHVEYGCGQKEWDDEGRIIRADFEKFSLISAYIPSGSSGEIRQQVKYRFLDFFQNYINELKIKYPALVIVGDYNICHKPIDIHNPAGNAKSSGFLPEEREWMGRFIDNGFVDSFRRFNKEPNHYTWWSQRFGPSVRARNLGWRIDYQLVSKTIESQIIRAAILPEAKHSDHCPTLLEMNF